MWRAYRSVYVDSSIAFKFMRIRLKIKNRPFKKLVCRLTWLLPGLLGEPTWRLRNRGGLLWKTAVFVERLRRRRRRWTVNFKYSFWKLDVLLRSKLFTCCGVYNVWKTSVLICWYVDTLHGKKQELTKGTKRRLAVFLFYHVRPR